MIAVLDAGICCTAGVRVRKGTNWFTGLHIRGCRERYYHFSLCQTAVQAFAMPSNFRVVLVLAAGAFAMAFCEEESSVRAVDKVNHCYLRTTSVPWIIWTVINAGKRTWFGFT